jgi:hypothetical protein
MGFDLGNFGRGLLSAATAGVSEAVRDVAHGDIGAAAANAIVGLPVNAAAGLAVAGGELISLATGNDSAKNAANSFRNDVTANPAGALAFATTVIGAGFALGGKGAPEQPKTAAQRAATPPATLRTQAQRDAAPRQQLPTQAAQQQAPTTSASWPGLVPWLRAHLGL